jgi:HAD superfamily hydrolase (TIGR01509 family)
VVVARLGLTGPEFSVPVRQLVWDMDGTLLDSSVAVPAAYVAAVRRLGGAPVSPEQVVASYPIGPAEALLPHLLGRELAAGESEAYYDELASVSVRPYSGIAEVLSALSARGHRLAVFTGASYRAAAMLLTGADINADVLVGGDEVRHPKPAGDGLLLAARRLGISASGIAYIGDAPNDMGAARAAGSMAVAAAWGHQFDAAVPVDITLAAPADALALLSAEA